ncbi:hypothetical protein [Mesorhizobium sp. BE184]|uniref:hypothetical protein n=1 Tax=Mesorhizobium sp. BE184 TaxID=2817714 RepID=UPI00285D1F45|nr:hypothetical protein [Mesorhizobium sp. BE184]MDR7035249.1 hypothetical protein [Mesorhizobium sp. BE184]
MSLIIFDRRQSDISRRSAFLQKSEGTRSDIVRFALDQNTKLWVMSGSKPLRADDDPLFDPLDGGALGFLAGDMIVGRHSRNSLVHNTNQRIRSKAARVPC